MNKKITAVDACVSTQSGEITDEILQKAAFVSRQMIKEGSTRKTFPTHMQEMSDTVIVEINSENKIEECYDTLGVWFQALILKNGNVIGSMSYFVFIQTTTCVIGCSSNKITGTEEFKILGQVKMHPFARN